MTYACLLRSEDLVSEIMNIIIDIGLIFVKVVKGLEVKGVTLCFFRSTTDVYVHQHNILFLGFTSLELRK